MAHAPTLNILPEARYKEINQGLALLLQARDLMNRARECGVDVTADEAYFDAAESNLNQWKQQFFANRP